METIENEWFGVYKSLLLGYKQDENFANDANMAISDSVYEAIPFILCFSNVEAIINLNY